ncbi:MAG TPA: hypothetical protein DD440_03095 [Porticoccaceae bacterium]|nr:hypothetical protein [Porticoccaceae bacterium]
MFRAIFRCRAQKTLNNRRGLSHSSLSDMRVLKLDMFFYTLYLKLSVVAKYAPACPKALFELSAYQRTLGE